MKTPLAILTETGVPLLLVGGTAVQIYGYSRYTKDFDCVVASGKDSLLSSALIAAGFVELVRNHLVVRYRHSEQPLWIVDTLLVTDSTCDKMWAQRREIRLGALALTVAAPLHVAAMKLHAMKQSPERAMHDLLDVMELLKRDRGNWSIEDLRAACERYGPPGIFETLQTHFS